MHFFNVDHTQCNRSSESIIHKRLVCTVNRLVCLDSQTARRERASLVASLANFKSFGLKKEARRMHSKDKKNAPALFFVLYSGICIFRAINRREKRKEKKRKENKRKKIQKNML